MSVSLRLRSEANSDGRQLLETAFTFRVKMQCILDLPATSQFLCQWVVFWLIKFLQILKSHSDIVANGVEARLIRAARIPDDGAFGRYPFSRAETQSVPRCLAPFNSVEIFRDMVNPPQAMTRHTALLGWI
ncbi:MAG: hypothetical protein AAFP16_11180 [Pseudomonadota bacterium]